MPQHNFIEDLYESLVEEGLKFLPRNTRFLYYNDGFHFLQRRDSGKTVRLLLKIDPLTAVRRGMGNATITKAEIAANPREGQIRWCPAYGLFGAPEGMPLRRVTWAKGEDPLTSYGFVEGGEYRRVLGTNWAHQRGSYSLWDAKAQPVLIRDDRIYIGKGKNPSGSSYDMWQADVGPDLDIKDIAQRINEYLIRQSYLRKPPASADYYDLTRWSYDEAANAWAFA